MRRARGLMVVALLLAVAAAQACALRGDARHRAVVGAEGLYAAIAVVDDTEAALHKSGVISDAQHAALNPKVVVLLRAGKAATTAVRTWPQDAPPPPELRNAVQQISEVAKAVTATLPDGPAKAKLLEKITLASDAANVILGLLEGVR